MEQALSEISAVRLEPHDFEKFWKQIQTELDHVPHIWDKWWTKESLWEGAMQGRFQVWAAGFGGEAHVILFTQIVYYPANTILQGILMLGNSLERCAPTLNAVLEQFAQERGCTMCEVTGRKGWLPFLRPYGFREQGVILHRPVHHQRVQ